MFTPNKKQKVFWLTTLMGMVVFFMTLASAQAQVSTKIEEKLSQTQKEVDKLFEIKDSTQISPEEKEGLEKEARVKIIFNVVDLSQTQLEELKEAWENIPNFPEAEDWQKIRELFLKEMEKSQEYWGETKDSFEEEKENLDIDGLKTLAKEIEEEKTAQIDPVIEQVGDIIMTFNLTEMLKVVDQRLEKVESDINKIYSKKLTKNQNLRNFYKQAAELIDQSHQLNDKSKEIILHLYSEDDSTSTEEFFEGLAKEFNAEEDQQIFKETASGEKPDKDDVKKEAQIYIRDLITHSLEKIREAYDIFVKMSSAAKQIIK